MAFGRQTGHSQPSVLEDLKLVQRVRKEESMKQYSNVKYAWLREIIKEAHEQIRNISIRYPSLEKPKPEDPRDMTPIPETRNHEYGWLSTRTDFQLETFGPDVMKARPLPEQYVLVKTEKNCF